jgi:hypothetical protein
MTTEQNRATRSARTQKPAPCVGCGAPTALRCPQCRRPTCRRAVGFCGHVNGICAVCVEARLSALLARA